MAKIEKFIPTLLLCEGGYVNDKDDKGGATKWGVTQKVYRSFYGQDKYVRSMTYDEMTHIYKVGYWDRCRADDIDNQNVANIFVDFAVNCGVQTAIKKTQRLLGVEADGYVGLKTLKALNAKEPHTLVADIKAVRSEYYRSLNQPKFLKGG